MALLKLQKTTAGSIAMTQHSAKKPEEAKHITFFTYEEPRALKRACQTLGYGEKEVETLCCSNAKALCRPAAGRTPASGAALRTQKKERNA